MVTFMRSTVRIDDDLMEALEARARSEGTSLAHVLNAVLRQELKAASESRAERRFEQRTASLGDTLFDTDKALSVAASLEDDAVLAKLVSRDRDLERFDGLRVENPLVRRTS